MKGHIHQKLMAQYAEDAKTTDKPWELWEVKGGADGIWYTLEENPSWCRSLTYRRKPKTRIIHGVEIPDLRVKGFNADTLVGYCVDPLDAKLHAEHYSIIPEITERFLEFGIIYEYTEEGKQAAILHTKAMLGVKP